MAYNEITVVKIKPWDELVKEFGLAKDGNFVHSKVRFHKVMNNQLPADRIIKVWTKNDNQLTWMRTGWIISKDIIINNEPIVNDTFNEIFGGGS